MAFVVSLLIKYAIYYMKRDHDTVSFRLDLTYTLFAQEDLPQTT